MRIDASNLSHRALNERIKQAIRAGDTVVEVTHVRGHRYIGCGLDQAATIRLEGIPGNDLAAFMSGPAIWCSGNVQDGVANTMDAGQVVVPGYAGDVLGYAMRGGEVFIRGNAGYRIGIHMKSYLDKEPHIVIGGVAKDFAGEYMAGGKLIILGLEAEAGQPLVGRYCGSGMHGGAMYVRGEVPPALVSKGVAVEECGAEDLAELTATLGRYCAALGLAVTEVMDRPFQKLRAVSTRPHGRLYAY